MNTKYRRCFCLFLIFVILTAPATARDLHTLEKEVIARAESAPDSAADYFMSQIEQRPAPKIEEQAVYLYGMGLAYEHLGNIAEAVDYYRGAELFDHQGAAEALIRLNRPPFPRPE